jgi:hypothetical protein
MKGAREYAKLFKTGQYGRLYIVSSHHARGKTFLIYVLPEKEVAQSNGIHNPPLNQDAVEVYGVICGREGWTEEYGWKHKGKWQDDFYELVREREIKLAEKQEKEFAEKKAIIEKRKSKEIELLSKY